MTFISSPGTSRRVGGPRYTVNATASPSGLPVTYSTLNATICEVNNNRVNFLAVGTCTVVATQVGDANWNSASNSQAFNVAIGQQTLNFTSQVDPVVLLGTTYNPVAVSTAPRTVNLTVDPISSGVCRIDGAGQVTNFNTGLCVLRARQAGDSFYAPAADVTQNYTIATVQFFSSLPQLFACATPSECAGNVSGIFFDQFAIEANLSALVAQANDDRTAANCSDSIWLQPCNFQFVNRVLALNLQRVSNLNTVLVNASSYNSSCLTSGCRNIIGVVFATYLPITQAAAIVCSSSLCRGTYLRSRTSAAAVYAGVPGALQAEIDRFDQEVEREAAYELYVLTSAYSACLTQECREALFPELNRTFAIQGYSSRAYLLGFQLRNQTAHRETMTSIDREFTACTSSTCNSTEFSSILGRKRAFFAVLIQWNNRLNELAANCTGACNSTGLVAARSTAQESLYTASDYLPSTVGVAGVVVYCLILVACIAIAVLAFVWKTFYGKFM